jgi:hypothetical protein
MRKYVLVIALWTMCQFDGSVQQLDFPSGNQLRELCSNSNTTKVKIRVPTHLRTACPQPYSESLENNRIFSEITHIDNYTLKSFMKSYIFWNITLCSPLKVSRRFWRTSSVSKNKPRKKTVLLATCFVLVSCFTYSWTLKMEETCSSDFQQTKRRYIPEDRSLYNHRCENLKSYIRTFFFVVILAKYLTTVSNASHDRVTVIRRWCASKR